MEEACGERMGETSFYYFIRLSNKDHKYRILKRKGGVEVQGGIDVVSPL